MSQNWDDMRFFLALCRHPSFTAAAAELRVTHSTVARRLAALEASLQTQLFQRTEKGCRITPAGETLRPYAEQLERTILGLEERVSGKNHQLSGAVRVGAPDGIGNCYLAFCLSRYQERHPALEVELVPVPMYYSLSKREIDISITVKKPTAENIVARKLTDYRLGLFSTRDYLGRGPDVETPEDLREHRIIGYIDDLLFDQDLRFLEEFHPGLQPRFRSSTVVAQMNAVIAGGGIGIIPYFMVPGNSPLVPVLPSLGITRSYWLQVNPDSRQLARVRATIDFIVEEIDRDRDRFLELPA